MKRLAAILLLTIGCEPCACTTPDTAALRMEFAAEIERLTASSESQEKALATLAEQLTVSHESLALQIASMAPPVEQPAPPLPAGWSVQVWTSVGCAACERWQHEQMPALSGSPVTLFDMQKSATEARRLSVAATPTIMLVDPDNMVRYRWRGYVDAATIIRQAEALSQQTTSIRREVISVCDSASVSTVTQNPFRWLTTRGSSQ